MDPCRGAKVHRPHARTLCCTRGLFSVYSDGFAHAVEGDRAPRPEELTLTSWDARAFLCWRGVLAIA
eukprot:4572236-Pyramimonas_sp.AAC.2